HGHNRYSEGKKKELNMGKISIATGYWLYSADSSLILYTDKLMQKGVGILKRNSCFGASERTLLDGYLGDRAWFSKFKFFLVSAVYRYFLNFGLRFQRFLKGDK